MARIYFCGKRIAGAFHTYYKVVFDDGRTTQYLRAGPSDPSTLGGPFNLSGMPTMGYLHVEYGDYVQGTKDFDDTGKNHFNELVYSGSDDVVTQKWDEMLQVAAEIEAS